MSGQDAIAEPVSDQDAIAEPMSDQVAIVEFLCGIFYPGFRSTLEQTLTPFR